MAMPDNSQRPVACDLTVFDPGQRQRYLALSRELFAACQQVRELPDGFAFAFPGEDSWCQKIVDWVGHERRCCPFLSFELIWEADGRRIELRLRGRVGTKEFLREELGALRSSR